MKDCEICGNKLAGSHESYKAHLKRFHSLVAHPLGLESKPSGIVGDGSTGMNGSKLIVAIKTTARNFERIVQDAEWTWGKAVFPDTRPVKW